MLNRTNQSTLLRRGNGSNRNRRRRRLLIGGNQPYNFPQANGPIAVLQSITEIENGTLQTTAIGVVSSTFAITPAVLIQAGRLAGYQAVADEIRIDSVTTVLIPILGQTAAGRMCLYIERDPTAAVVASVSLAFDQRESVRGSPRDRLSITWVPQEPDDRQFNLLNPGTVSLGSFMVLGDTLADSGAALPNATVFYTVQHRIRFTVRGRP